MKIPKYVWIGGGILFGAYMLGKLLGKAAGAAGDTLAAPFIAVNTEIDDLLGLNTPAEGDINTDVLTGNLSDPAFRAAHPELVRGTAEYEALHPGTGIWQ